MMRASPAMPPVPLDAAIIFAPIGVLVPQALRALKKGGRVVCGGIHMSDMPSFPYSWLWEEREVVSVANLMHSDAWDFLRNTYASMYTRPRMFILCNRQARRWAIYGPGA